MKDKITGKTVLTCLLGSPVSHSISPLMHNEAFRLLDLDYAYLAFDVNTDQLKTAVEGLKVLGVRGFNLTMPNKNKMCELADELSQAAAMMEAVNTVVYENGKLIGHNTDGYGYMRSVKEAGYDVNGKKMTIIGGGGAATSICIQAALDGVSEMDIFCRAGNSYVRAEKMVETISKNTLCKASLYDIADIQALKSSLATSYLLTNATSVGMAPHIEESVITDTSLLHRGLIVSDIIYNPRETLLLKLAREAGCNTFNGLYMLLYQGAKAFELWTGKEMPVAPIKKKYFSSKN